MAGAQIELPGFREITLSKRFPDQLGFLEAASLLPFARRSPVNAEATFRRRRGDLTRLAIEQWENTDKRFGDDLTKARLHQLVEMAIEMERQSGILDFPSVEKQKLDQRVRSISPSLDSTLKWDFESELVDRQYGKGAAHWFNQMDLIEARESVDPTDKPMERGHPRLAEVLKEQFIRISEGNSKYHFGKRPTDPNYTPGLVYADRAEDRYLTDNHAITTIGFFLARYSEDLSGLNLRKVDYLKGFRLDDPKDFSTALRSLILHEDWLSRFESLDDILTKKSIAA